MATVHVLVGQCGNQVGTAFLDAIASAAEASTDAAYQMRVSATHFRPAMRTPVRQRRTQRARNTDQSSTRTHETSASTAATGASPEQSRRWSGGQKYYSLSRYAQDAPPVDDTLPQPRCVLVDMEPKVIDASMQHANACLSSPSYTVDGNAGDTFRARPFYSLAPQQCVTRGEGSGNNWAFGYYQQGRSRREAIADCLRRESEQQGAVVSTFHVLHSIAGGTGSGVGCLVAEEIKLLFPRSTLLHSVVWPFACGEVVTQWYNVLMAVATLRDVADGVCIASNDAIAEELRGTCANRGLKNAGEVSFPLMNQRISEMLAPLHLPQLLYATPTPRKDIARNRIAGRELAEQPPPDTVRPRRYATASDIVETLTLDPAMKFFTGVSSPKLVTGSSTWSAVLCEAARAAQQEFTVPSALCAYSGNDGGHAAAAAQNAVPSLGDASAFYMQHRSCLWSLRGRYCSTEGLRELRHLMATSGGASSSPYATPFPLTSLFVSPSEEWRETPAYAARSDHGATLYGPTPSIGRHFAEAAGKAEELLNAGAFVHHFERYGVSKAELRDAAAVMWDTAMTYQGALDVS